LWFQSISQLVGFLYPDFFHLFVRNFFPCFIYFSDKCALTVNPVDVFVVRMYLKTVSKDSKGRPAQFLLISLKRRCAMGFHFDDPGGYGKYAQITQRFKLSENSHGAVGKQLRFNSI
jgi:hypothetical protein